MNDNVSYYLTVKDILKQTEGELICGDESTICVNFSKDTRQINDLDTYIGIKGDTFDGNQFYKDALDKGASGCIIQNIDISEEDKEKYKDKYIIKVNDTILALQQIATYKRSKYNIPVIAVTGSVGKTSTKDLVASVIEEKYKVLKTPGNLNNHIGLPFTILSLKDEEALVIEMGMNNFGEISVLTNIAKPDVAVITNIGTAHIGNLGSRENILKAKLEIIEGLSKDGVLIINHDNDQLNMWNKINKDEYNVITYGIKEKSDFMAKNIELFENRSIYTLEYEGKEYTVEVPIGGEHFVLNSLCAVSVGSYFKIDIKDIISGIEKFELTKKRMELRQLDNGASVINDSYNANYDSVKAAIDYLNDIKDKRKIVVLGDMLELGDYTEHFHKEIGKIVANSEIEILVTIGKLSADIANSAKEYGMESEKVYNLDNNQKAIDVLNNIIQKDDIILIKASNSMKFWEIADALK